MPFKSQAQRRLFYAKAARGEISRAKVREWERETPKDEKLPEKVAGILRPRNLALAGAVAVPYVVGKKVQKQQEQVVEKSAAARTGMDNKRRVKARVRQQLQALPMGRPENKPDLAVEDAEKPVAGGSTKTAALVKAALSKALLERAAEIAGRRGKALSDAMEELGSRAVIPRDIRSSAGQEIAKLRTQADVFAGGGKALKPRAMRVKTTRETSEQVKRRLADRDVTRAARGPTIRPDDATRLNPARGATVPSDPTRVRPDGTTRPGVVPQPLEPTRAGVVPQTVSAGPMPAPAPPPPSAQAGQTFIGNAPQPSAAAEATRIAGPVAPVAMTPERAAQLRAANPQSFTPAPAPVPAPPPRPMSVGRGALILGSSTLAGAMMNRPVQQQQPAAV